MKSVNFMEDIQMFTESNPAPGFERFSQFGNRLYA